MRTTVELPDSLFRQAKLAAANRGHSLKTFITQAIARELEGAQSTSRRARQALPAIRVPDDAPILRLEAADLARVDADAEVAHYHASGR